MNNIDRGVEVSIPFYNEHISQDIINEIMLLIKSNGGKVVTSVSKNLTYLISGESSGSKLESAKNLGVTIITEDELVKLLEIEKSIQDTSINAQKSLMDF